MPHTDGVNHKKSYNGSASDNGERRPNGMSTDGLGPNFEKVGRSIHSQDSEKIPGERGREVKSALGHLDGRTTDGENTRYSSTNDRNDARGGRFINVACSTALAPDGPM